MHDTTTAARTSPAPCNSTDAAWNSRQCEALVAAAVRAAERIVRALGDTAPAHAIEPARLLLDNCRRLEERCRYVRKECEQLTRTGL